MKPTNWLVLISIILLSACGGGGDSGDNPSPGTFSSATSLFNGNVRAVALAANSDDIYVGGDFTAYNGTSSNRIIRLNSDGSIDTRFDVGSGFNDTVRSIAVATDGRGDIYVGGDFTTYNGTGSNGIIRLNSDGSIDSGFNVGSGFNGEVTSIAVDPGGDIYVGGAFTNYRGSAKNKIAHIMKNGDNDNTVFNVGSGFNGNVHSIAVDPAGGIYVGGGFTTYRGNAKNRIAHIWDNGDNDNTVFNVGSGFNGSVRSIAVDPAGGIYVGGGFTTYRGNARNNITRIKNDGSDDASFVGGTGFNGPVISIAVATGGDIYAGGFFTSYRGNVRDRIARIKNDGANDGNFGVGAGFENGVNSVAVATDGSGDIYVGGIFTTHGTTAVGYIARVDSVGQLR